MIEPSDKSIPLLVTPATGTLAPAEPARLNLFASEVAPLGNEGLLRAKPSQKDGHFASGPLVVTSRIVVNWSRDV